MHMKLDSGELAKSELHVFWMFDTTIMNNWEHDYAQRTNMFNSIETMEMPSKNHYYPN